MQTLRKASDFKMYLDTRPAIGHSHSDLRELLFGQVQRMVDGSDSIFVQVSSFGQVCTEDGVVGHVHERDHGMPALIVVPHLCGDSE